MSIRILQGDCREVLKTLPDESVHCCVTSPPYWGLRDYGVDGQMGIEPTLSEFVSGMVSVFREVKRVLRKDGTLWLNLGDSYAALVNGRSAADTKATGKDDRTFRDKPFSTVGGGIKPKDLCGIPWRMAFALQADGWWLRQDIIWSKPNPMPESVTDRCTKAHEYIFLLSKSSQYFYDADAVRESHIRLWDSSNGGNLSPGGIHKANGNMRERGGAYPEPNPLGRNRRSVWTVATQPFREAHFATFPPDLIEPCVKAGCPQFTCGNCGTVLDRRYEKARSNTDGKAVPSLQMVREQGDAGSQESRSKLLQQDMRGSMVGQEPAHDKGLHDQHQGISASSETGPPQCDPLRLRNGTSAGDGESLGSPSSGDRGRASQRRQQIKQRPGKPASANEDHARQDAEEAHWDDTLPALQGEDSNFSICPRCRSALNEVGIKPGVVLDCFGGAGTTGLVADRHGRNAILIELNPDYAAMATNRIRGDAPLFTEVA